MTAAPTSPPRLSRHEIDAHVILLGVDQLLQLSDESASLPFLEVHGEYRILQMIVSKDTGRHDWYEPLRR
jgi:hypothetical protein